MIKFLDIQKINARYSKELKKISDQVIDSGWYLKGEQTNSFEIALANYLNIKNVISVGNGLDALRLILRAYLELGKLRPGDEIIVPGNTFIASFLAVTENNLKPIFIEPDIETFNIDISKIERNLSKRTKAILIVHLYGQIFWSEELKRISKEKNLLIIEDNAQAIGAEWNGKKSGTLGHASAFSFYPGKNLGALGDSGAVATNDDDLADVISSLANYGSNVKYVHDYEGYNSRMDEIQAAFLKIKLEHLDSDNQKRREIAQYYCDHIKNSNLILPNHSNKKTDLISKALNHVWHLFVIRSSKRDDLKKHCEKRGIQTLIHYPIPPHKQKAYERYRNLVLPVTELLHQTVLSIPISPVLENEEIEEIVSVVNSFH